MRIVVFNPLKRTLARGIPIYASEIAEAMRRLGHQVTEESWPKNVGKLPYALQVMLLIFYHQVIFPFRLAIHRPDLVVEPYSSYSLLAALHYKVLVVYHDFLAFRSPFWVLKPLALYQRLLHQCLRILPNAHICCVSPSIAKEAGQYISRADRIDILPNEIQPLHSKLEEKDDASALVEMNDGYAARGFKTICTISGDGLNKDFKGLLYTLRSLRSDIFLTAFGFSEDRIEEFVSSEGGTTSLVVRVVGPVSGATMAAVMRRADLFLFHSLGEGFGRPVAEALLEDRIVITDDVPAVQMLSDDARKNVIVCRVASDLPTAMTRALGLTFSPFQTLLKNDLTSCLRRFDL